MVVSNPVVKRPTGRSRGASVSLVSRYVVVTVNPAPLEKGTNLSDDEHPVLIAKVWDSIDHSTRPMSPADAGVVDGKGFVRVFASVTAVDIRPTLVQLQSTMWSAPLDCHAAEAPEQGERAQWSREVA